MQPVPLSPKTPATAKQQTPPTAKNETKFTFELTHPKSAYSEDSKSVYVSDNQDNLRKTTRPAEGKTVDMLMEEQIEALKLDARRRNSYKQAAQNCNEIEVGWYLLDTIMICNDVSLIST